jgi:quinoprotein glucose dehydrogenase
MFKLRFRPVGLSMLSLWLATAPQGVFAAANVRRGAGYPPPVQPASDEGEAALKRFRVPKGLKVELAAAEPLLANPVAFSIDEHGRFYVAETFRLHAGVTDIRGHMDWLDEELAVKTVEERVAYMTRHEGKRIAEYTNHSDRLRLIWDSDGDGRADKASVLADGFNGVAEGIAAGVLARRGEVYFANIPNLWRFTIDDLRSTNPPPVDALPLIPGRINRKSKIENLSTGYGIRVGFLGHDLHGLRFGPDGRLYFSVGDRGAHVRTKEGKTIELHETGAVFRCDPDGSNLEVFATGLRNPQELVFDQFGNLWTGDNNSDGGDPARWVYVVEGGDSGWRIGWQFINQPNSRGPWLAERMCYPHFEGQAAYILPPLANIGNGPSGLAYHPGTGLNDRYKDRFFLCDFRGGTGSGVHSFGVKPRGAGFEVIDRTEFLWDVLVTDCEFGPDGCFYVTDWVNGWNLTGKGRIYRVFDPETRNSPLVLETKKLIAEGFVRQSAEELKSLLAHPDQRVRLEAQFSLASQWTGIPTFSAALHGESQSARLHAIWGLGQIGRTSPAAIDSLLPLLGDTFVEVRAQTAKVFGDLRATQAYEPLLKLLSDPDPRPRFFAAIALGKLGRKEAVPSLIEMLRANANKDVYLRHAGVMGLVGCADAATLQKFASDESSEVRLAAVVALRRMERPEVADFLRDKEPTVVLEAARAINDLPIPAALPELAALLMDAEVLAGQQFGSRQQRQRAAAAKNPKKPEPEQEPDVLFEPLLRRIVNAHYRLGAPANASALVTFAASGVGPSAVRAEAISTLGEWAKPSGRDNVTGLWRPLETREPVVAKGAVREKLDALLQDPSGSVELAALKVAMKLGVAEAATTAFKLLADGQRSGKVRVEALRALAAFKSAKLNDAVKLALADQDEALRAEATRIQAQLKPSDAAARLRTVLEKGGTGERQAAFATLGTLPGSAADELLARWLDRLNAKQVPPELQLDLLEAAAKRQAREVKERLDQFERARPAEDEMRAFRECLNGGDAAEGRRIFIERADVFCFRCHKVNGEGGDAGPDLTGIASRKPRDYLLESIVYPNKQIAAGFENVVLTLKAGDEHAGLLKAETDSEIEINSPEDGLLKLKKTDIKTRERGPSAMPEELRQILNKRDIRNLVEFLGSLK